MKRLYIKPVTETALLTIATNTILMASEEPNAKIDGDSDPIDVNEVESRRRPSIWDDEEEDELMLEP